MSDYYEHPRWIGTQRYLPDQIPDMQDCPDETVRRDPDAIATLVKLQRSAQ